MLPELALLTLQACEPWCWNHQEARTSEAKKVIIEFEKDYARAKAKIAPYLDVKMEAPEAELYIGGQRATAYTTYDEEDGKFLVRIDWRLLLALDPSMRKHVAYHEVCHLTQAKIIMSHESISLELRIRLEMDAEKCVVVALAGDNQE